MRFRIPRLDRTYRQALLVQQDQERIEDISVIERILKNRGYNTTIIGVGECTKRNVLSGIEQLIERSKKDSRSLFYYTGHGSEMPGYTNGISMNKGISKVLSLKLNENLAVEDINNILKILIAKREKKNKVKIFAIPNELNIYKNSIKESRGNK